MSFITMPCEEPRRLAVFLMTIAMAAVVAIAAWIVIGDGAVILALAMAVCFLPLLLLMHRSQQHRFRAEGSAPETWRRYHS